MNAPLPPRQADAFDGREELFNAVYRNLSDVISYSTAAQNFAEVSDIDLMWTTIEALRERVQRAGKAARMIKKLDAEAAAAEKEMERGKG